MKWTGIFGGSFNPPHLGHLLAAAYALKAFELDEVWFVPAYRHAFEKKLAPYDARVEMCKRLIDGFGPRLKVSTIEKTLNSKGETLKTLLALRKKHPDRCFTLIVGSDLVRQTKRWHRYPDIKERFGVLVVPRGTRENGPFAVPDISSTEVRRRLRSKQPLDPLLTPSVASYVTEHKLY